MCETIDSAFEIRGMALNLRPPCPFFLWRIVKSKIATSKTGDFYLKILETERLLLRQLSIDDAEFILELLNEPSFIQNIGDRGVRTQAEARSYLLNGPIASYAQNGFGLYLVVLK